MFVLWYNICTAYNIGHVYRSETIIHRAEAYFEACPQMFDFSPSIYSTMTYHKHIIEISTISGRFLVNSYSDTE